MTDSNMNSHELELLIAAWLDGRLDDEGSHTLQNALRTSRAARETFRQYARLDAALHDVADTSAMLDLTKLAAACVRPSSAEQSPTHAQESSDTEGSKTERRQRPFMQQMAKGSRVKPTSRKPIASLRMTPWYAALAVGILLVAFLIRGFSVGEPGAESIADLSPSEKTINTDAFSKVSLSKPPAPVAVLSSVEGVIWADSQLEVGHAFFEGESIRLEQGEARVSVGFGAEIVADAPCSLKFLSSDRIQLHDGEIAVDVAPWAAGFTVVTEEMDVVDLGTTFTVSVEAGEKAETTVLRGVVRVHPTKIEGEPRRGLLVSEGQRMSSDGKGAFVSVPHDQDEVQKQLGRLDFGVTGPYRPVDLSNTGQGLSTGDEDLHWQVVAGPTGVFSEPQYASVCEPERGYLPNDPDVSQWISTADWRTALPNAVYTFRTEFALDGYDLATMQLFGRFLADNGIESVRVNGNPVEVQSWVDNVKYQAFGDLQFRFVNITGGLVSGRNVVEIDVRNGMMRTGHVKDPPLSPIPNPMALRVEWYAFGRQQGIAQADDGVRLWRRIRDSVPPMSMLSYAGPEI